MASCLSCSSFNMADKGSGTSKMQSHQTQDNCIPPKPEKEHGFQEETQTLRPTSSSTKEKDCDQKLGSNAASSTCSIRKMKKFTFTETYKMLLLKCVRSTDAHRVRHGDHDRKYSEVLKLFLENIPSRVWEWQCRPSVKTLRDKMRMLILSRKKQNRENIAASGITEDVTDFQRLLDDIILEKDDYELQQVEERERANANEQKLVEAGKLVQRMALERKRRREVKRTEGEPTEMRATIRQKTSDSSILDDETQWNVEIQKHLNDKQRLEERRLALEEKELELRRAQWEETKLDREIAREQSRKQLELMSVLIGKLEK